ncbi:Alpha/Beta hydrolase protein [Massariosphaeria phaeospora]|uniref:Alpha/Beta hydrolase protein n=1 Tax=Massariosphaeria phaeospora TaxID=100035 RepID=A0A7C8IE70_9PLEO|nr:Alpha/Beta hydrolase protein [Massariosphaeria phaeospora]
MAQNFTMPTARLGYLPVPGADLYYEVQGSGPLVLFISGANGNADVWRMMAAILAQNYTVALYDRRGYSRSHLSSTQPQDYAHKLDTDADDAALLVEHLSPGTPATVMGTSSGAIVALQLLQRHPDCLRTLIAHEPPAIKVLPDSAALEAAQRAVYTTYRAGGIPPALLQFAAVNNMHPIMVAGLISSMDAKIAPDVAGNSLLWFERELLPYPLADLDIDAIAKQKAKLVLLIGEGSPAEALYVRANRVISERVGVEVQMVPGEHVDYAVNPMGFATRLMGVLARRG